MVVQILKMIFLHSKWNHLKDVARIGKYSGSKKHENFGTARIFKVNGEGKIKVRYFLFSLKKKNVFYAVIKSKE